MNTQSSARRIRPTAVAAVLLLLVPILEIIALIAVGQALGGWWTFLLLVTMSLLGAWLIRREGARAWRNLTQALGSGRMPARELADGMLVLVGGTLLLLPGFITDAVGLFLVLPATRPIARSLLETVVQRRLLVSGAEFGPAGMFRPGVRGPGQSAPRRSSASDEVIEGEIIED